MILKKSEVEDFLRIVRKKPGTRLAMTSYLVALSRTNPSNPQRMHVDVGRLERLIALARKGDRAAQHTARFIASHFIECKVEMPDFLENYITEELRSSKVTPLPPGKDPYDNDVRDYIILMTVLDLMEKKKLRATRNRAAKDKGGRHSACSLAAAALAYMGIHLTESAVEKIFREQVRRLQLP